MNVLLVPRSRCKYGDRAFSVAGPTEWNKLPCYLRTITSIEQFKSSLKTFLFKEFYDV